MAAITLTIDGEVVINGDLGDWDTNPPQILRDQLAAHAKPKPWMRCLLIALADAAMMQQDATLDVVTGDGTWTLSVASGKQ